MPVMKYSAMDPSGTYQSDAMDQVEQWNANRGDQWSRYALSLMEKRQDDARQAAADDWRKEVALKQLGLQESMWKGGREDTAAARAAEADRWGKQFDYMRGRDASADARWKTQFDEDKLDRKQQREWRNFDIEERRGLATQRAAEATALGNFAPKGVDPEAWKAMPLDVKRQVAANALARQIERGNRPEQRAEFGENARIESALNIINNMQGRRDLTPNEFAEFNRAKAVVQSAGMGDPTGGVATQARAPEQAARQIISAIDAKAKELAGGAAGFASEDDINTIKSMVGELRNVMQEAGYPEEAIAAQVELVRQKLAAVAPQGAKRLLSGPLWFAGVGQGFTQSDINAATGG